MKTMHGSGSNNTATLEVGGRYVFQIHQGYSCGGGARAGPSRDKIVTSKSQATLTISRSPRGRVLRSKLKLVGPRPPAPSSVDVQGK